MPGALPPYDPQQIEPEAFARWQQEGLFLADPERAGSAFSMVMPPPNVTGSLHIGHALNNTLPDVLARYRRMRGENVAWIPGTDHAGIATQNVVERELAKEKKTRHDLGREAFVGRVWAWKEEYGQRIIGQLQRLGCGADYSRERFTMEPGLSAAVRKVFVTLFHEGLVYRAARLISWCTRCRTALSDIEVEHRERDGVLAHIRYPFEGESQRGLVIATTRPETLLADTGVAVHPDDARYRDLVGRKVIVPLVQRPVPVVADAAVEMEFGTGCLKVTPLHDPKDFEIGQRHRLESVNILEPDGRLSATAGLYAGLTVKEARKRVMADLEAQGLLIKVENIRHSVGECSRCQTVVEPYFSLQWFVKMSPLRDAAVAAVDRGEVRFVPESWKAVYDQWMANLRDWCISRQLWWGHQIPAWMCEACAAITVPGAGTPEKDPTACSGCGGSRLRQDPDVLDTWFSSWLWPFSTMGWPEATPEFKKFYPTKVLITGWDILFFWVARMIMAGVHFTGKAPFEIVYLTSLIGDEEGKKMSKSKGNVVDPLDLIAKYGADALRFTLVSGQTELRYVSFAEGRVESAGHFANKIWNAGKFVFMRLEGFREAGPRPAVLSLGLADRWILSRLSRAIESATRQLETFEFSAYATTIYEFVWKEYCDWYLEIAKHSLTQGPDAKRAAEWTLGKSFGDLLKLVHPLMPHVTETLWRGMPGNESATSLGRVQWPVAEGVDEGAEREMGIVQRNIEAIRRVRSEMKLVPRIILEGKWAVPDEGERKILEANTVVLDLLCNGKIALTSESVGTFGWTDPKGGDNRAPDGMERAKEQTTKEIEQLTRVVAGIRAKLANEAFVSRAPAAVVEGERAKIVEFERKIQQARLNLPS